MANAVGRPLKFQSVEELDKRIDEYFKSVGFGNDIETITGLAVYLDTSRQTLVDYKEKPEYTDSIKRALAKCEAAIEKRSMLGGINATMSIFTLKNNYGWKDKTEQDITTAGEKIESHSLDTDMLTQFMMQAKNDTKQ